MSLVNRTLFPLQSSFNQIKGMQQRFDKLQLQLATGQKATNLAEMGGERYFDLSLRSRLSRIEGYAGNIGTVNLRLDVMDQAVSRLDTIEGDARAGFSPGAYGTSNINFSTVPSLARARLDEVVSLLNTDVDGRYVFAGNRTDARPVASIDALLEGAGGRAGFRQVAAERLAADQGAAGLGRLTLSAAADTVSLAEDGDHPFGFKLASVTASGSALTLTQPAGTAPQSLAVKFDAAPSVGDKVNVTLSLPDGSSETITLTATDGTPAAGEFQVSGDVNACAANFSAALNSALATASQTKLAAASNFAAADDFFAGQGGQVLRVAGPPYDSATALVAADPATTVTWYSGQDAADARGTVTARVDEGTVVRYGAQANETGPAELVRSLAVAAIQTFASSDATAGARFDAVAQRNIARLAESRNGEAGSVEMMGVELGNTRAAVDSISSRHTTTKSQFEGLLSDIETVPSEDVAMEILALQTRLQASYQATAMMSQMSLANYLG